MLFFIVIAKIYYQPCIYIACRLIKKQLIFSRYFNNPYNKMESGNSRVSNNF